jgi:NAD(P)-dependent dehydrogenase (short-subunit alcohol dehydrogenase family)
VLELDNLLHISSNLSRSIYLPSESADLFRERQQKPFMRSTAVHRRNFRHEMAVEFLTGSQRLSPTPRPKPLGEPEEMENDMERRPVYVILGGSSGIGSAVARNLVAGGAKVALAARGAERLESLAAELGSASTGVVDATNMSAVENFVRSTADANEGIDGIVNCVGSILLKAAHQTREEEWRHTISANLDSAFATVRAGAKVMGRSGGSIVLMASAAARVGLPSHEAIAAAKAGVIGLARSAAATYAGKGIRVNAVAPGLVDTPMSAGITSNEMMLKASTAMHPLGRIGSPEEVASVIAWLLSEESSWVTGQVIGIDGGLATVRGKASA